MQTGPGKPRESAWRPFEAKVTVSGIVERFA
jgi:hypothetical protein